LSKESKARKARKPAKAEGVKPEYIQALLETGLTPDLIEKARGELVREKYVTPFKVAQRYGIKVSTARRLLRILAGEGLLSLVSGTRRTRIYVPRQG